METELVYLSLPQGTLEKLEIVAARKGLAVEQVVQEAINEFLELPSLPEYFGVRIERTHAPKQFNEWNFSALFRIIPIARERAAVQVVPIAQRSSNSPGVCRPCWPWCLRRRLI
jgi:hypothetical protein